MKTRRPGDQGFERIWACQFVIHRSRAILGIHDLKGWESHGENVIRNIWMAILHGLPEKCSGYLLAIALSMCLDGHPPPPSRIPQTSILIRTKNSTSSIWREHSVYDDVLLVFDVLPSRAIVPVNFHAPKSVPCKASEAYLIYALATEEQELCRSLTHRNRALEAGIGSSEKG